MKKERGLWELYESDPEKAHAEIFESPATQNRANHFCPSAVCV
jgi:hypothetical protein